MAARARYRVSMVAPSRSGIRGAVRRWPSEAISTAPRARAREPVSNPEGPAIPLCKLTCRGDACVAPAASGLPPGGPDRLCKDESPDFGRSLSGSARDDVSDDKVDVFVTMSSAFHQGVGYEHGTDRFRSAQAPRANAAGSPLKRTDGFRSASSLRANAAGSPLERWAKPRSRTGSTRFSSPRAASASRQPSGGSAGTGRQQPGRRSPRLAQEAVWRLSRLRGPIAGPPILPAKAEVFGWWQAGRAEPGPVRNGRSHRELRLRRP